MKIILEIIRLVKREGLESSKMFNLNKPENLVDRFVVLALEEKATTDDQMSALLYRSKKRHKNYSNLKRRVKQKLIEVIPLIDPSHLGFNSKHNKAYHECLKATNLIILLSRTAAYNTALHIIKKHYKTATKYQFYDILTDFSYHRIRINSVIGNFNIAQKESKLLNEYIQESNRIRQMHDLYLKNASELSNKSLITEKELRIIDDEIIRCNNIAKNSNSWEVKFWQQYTLSYFYTIKKDLKHITEAINKIENILDKWKTHSPSRRIALNIRIASLNYILKRHANTVTLINNDETNLGTRLNNWTELKKYEYYSVVNLDSQKAQDIIRDIFESDIYKLNNNKSSNQIWNLHNAYLYITMNDRKEPIMHNFNMFKLINEFDFYSKDKSGYNFSIFVAELIYYLIKNDLDCYIDRMTALTNYRTRHLRHPDFRRSYVFAGLLLQVYKHGFSPHTLRTKCKKEYEYLCTDEDRLHINEWEIVDYDKLWLIILEVLERRLAK